MITEYEDPGDRSTRGRSSRYSANPGGAEETFESKVAPIGSEAAFELAVRRVLQNLRSSRLRHRGSGHASRMHRVILHGPAVKVSPRLLVITPFLMYRRLGVELGRVL